MDALIDDRRARPARKAAPGCRTRAGTGKHAAPAGRGPTFEYPSACVHPAAPNLGAAGGAQMPLEMVFKHLFKNELFRLSWGAKNATAKNGSACRAEFEARLERMQRAALRERLAASAGRVRLLARPGGGGRAWFCTIPASLLERWAPGVKSPASPSPPAHGERLCLADYFPGESGPDGCGRASGGDRWTGRHRTLRPLQEAGDYSEAYFTHGLAVQTAEATAEYLHRHIRRELGLAEGQGKRYSWGYPAIPDLEDHRKVFDLLPAERANWA
jgi:5-methyltetrahydrofolate--homocysteine methyltransferase